MKQNPTLVKITQMVFLQKNQEFLPLSDRLWVKNCCDGELVIVEKLPKHRIGSAITALVKQKKCL